MSLSGIEFFSHEGEIWMRAHTGAISKISPANSALVDALLESVRRDFPDACRSLEAVYKSVPQPKARKWRIVSRFIRCNFAILDHVPDYVDGSFSNFEAVQCPLRSECRHEGVICRPKYYVNLSAAEMRVMKLWHSGQSKIGIAQTLCLSLHTVHNHIRNAYGKLGVNSRSQFVKLAERQHLFS